MSESERPRKAVGVPGKLIPARINLGPPKPGMCQPGGTYGEDFQRIKHLLSNRPLKGIDPPPKRGQK
jgi:hypothetical protein